MRACTLDGATICGRQLSCLADRFHSLRTPPPVRPRRLLRYCRRARAARGPSQHSQAPAHDIPCAAGHWYAQGHKPSAHTRYLWKRVLAFVLRSISLGVFSHLGSQRLRTTHASVTKPVQRHRLRPQLQRVPPAPLRSALPVETAIKSVLARLSRGHRDSHTQIRNVKPTPTRSARSAKIAAICQDTTHEAG